MKVTLRQEGAASVLDVQGELDVHNFAVLKAGLSKLLQNGKNKIVLHLESSGDISGDLIRELAILDVFARELSGKLVIAADDPAIKEKLKTFAKPPLVPIVASVAKAVEYLQEEDSAEGEEAGEDLAQAQAMIAALEARLKLGEQGDNVKLRAENAQLKDRVKLLEGQVAELLGGPRKSPGHTAGYEEKIQALEETVRRLGGEKLAGAKS